MDCPPKPLKTRDDISCVHTSLVSRPQVYQQLKYTISTAQPPISFIVLPVLSATNSTLENQAVN